MSKNLIAFFALSIVVIVGWTYLQKEIWPPPKTPDKKLAQAKDEKKDAAKNDDKKADDAKKQEPAKKDEKADDKKVDPKKVEEKKIEEKKEEDPIPAPAEVQPFYLGDDTSYLKLVLTNRGAGVQRLTLTRFQAADYLGRPSVEKGPDGKVVERKLEFIQDDPFVPSFLMGVYGDADKGTEFQPALGAALWKPVTKEPEKDDKGWTMSFWTLVPNQRNLKVVKTYRLSPVEYHVRLSVEIQNVDEKNKALVRYQLTGAHGLPIEGEWYTPTMSIRTSVIGKLDGETLYRKQEDAAHIVSIKDAKGKPGKEGTKEFGDATSPIQYAGVMTQYFASVILPDPEQPSGKWRKAPNIIGSARPTVESDETKARILEIDDNKDKITFVDLATNEKIEATMLPRAKEHLAELKLKPGARCVLNVARNPMTPAAVYVQWCRLGDTPLTYLDDVTVRVASDALTLNAGEKVTHRYWLYHGPVKTRLLGQMERGDEVKPELVKEYTYGLHLNTLTDYPSDIWISREVFNRIGWTSLLIWCTNLMHTLLYYLHFVSFGSWGFSIILLTVVVRGAMFPISRKQALMGQKMQLLAPEIQKLKEKYKDDKAAQAQATMELYRKHKVSPAGGCLPLLLQMPIFLGLYYCLQESVQFRLAQFLWIDNLAAPDMLFWWGQGIPWINAPSDMGSILYLGPYFNLLPLFAVGLMLVQQKYMTPPPQTEEQEVQQKTMRVMMAVMGIFFYKVAAGLCLYFIASSVWGVLERKFLPKKTGPADANAKLAPPTPSKPVSNARDRRKEREKEKNQPETAITRLKAWWRKILESAEKK